MKLTPVGTQHAIGQEGAVITEAQWAPEQALPLSLQTDSTWPWVPVCQRQEAVVTMVSGNISRFTQNRPPLLSFPGPELPNAWILRHDGNGLGRTH